jgi:DegV family protein with EDD domain
VTLPLSMLIYTVRTLISTKMGVDSFMEQTRIVTNAVCDFTPETAKRLNVTIVPECIMFGDEQYLSFIDFQPSELYDMLEKADKPPTGSQPNVGMYISAFESLRGQCTDIICLNMTSVMSGSFNTAMIAKGILSDEDFPANIHIFDSLQLSHGLGFLVKMAAEMAIKGARCETILEKLEIAKSKIGTYFVLRSLESAARGGRLGNIKATLADKLDLKPVLMFRDGIESDIAIVRSFRQALSKLPTYYEKQGSFGREITVFHADNLTDALKVKDALQSLDPQAKISVEWLGSGIGIYTGAGCVGITFWEG